MSQKHSPKSNHRSQRQSRPPYELLCIAVIFLAAAVMLFMCHGGGVVLMHSGGTHWSSGPVTGAEAVSELDLQLVGIVPLFLGLLTIWFFLRVRKDLGGASRLNHKPKR